MAVGDVAAEVDVCAVASICSGTLSGTASVGWAGFAGNDSVIGVGCAGPVAWDVELAAPAVPPVWGSSARLMVYERNGASSEEVARDV